VTRSCSIFAVVMTIGGLQGLSCPNVPVCPTPFFYLLAVPMQLPSHHFRSRFAALRPGGPVSTRFFGTNPTVLQVGSTVFVHGGLLPKHVDYGLDRISEYAFNFKASYGMKLKALQLGALFATVGMFTTALLSEHVVISIPFFKTNPQVGSHGVRARGFLPRYVDQPIKKIRLLSV
jgi:hypothetical protein